MYLCGEFLNLIVYSAGRYALTKDEEMKLRIRMGDFVEETVSKYAIFPTLITTFGVKPNTYSGIVQSEVVLSDLF